MVGKTFGSKVLEAQAHVLLEVYAPWCGLLPRHPLLSSYFLTLAVEPRVVTDCVPIVHSYMQPLQLLKSACVCKDLCKLF